MMRASPLALALGASFLSFGPTALAQEYREFTLSDGRVIYSELLATEVAGLRIRVPAGETEIPFTLLVDMVPASEAQFSGQSDWKVLIDAPESVRPKLVAAFAAIPGVVILGEAGAPAPLTPAQLKQLEDCQADIECMVFTTASAPWMWLVSAKVTGEGAAQTVTLTSRLNSGPTGADASFPLADNKALQAATFSLLDVRPAPGTPPLSGPEFAGGDVVKNPKGPKAPSAGGGGSALVPVPGWTALKQDDMAGFGIALGVVLPATAAYFAASGHNSQSAPEGILLGVGGYYVATVLANHIVGQRGAKAGDLMVVPAPVGSGAGVAVGIRR